jgi:NTP pyrophosphatase (non-canonical NTP hydrolase)
MTTLNDYQALATATAIFPEEVALPYLSLGLASEAGEVAGKIKKVLRGDYELALVKGQLRKELGDVLWYLAVLAEELDISLEILAQENLNKLRDRKRNGTIQGDGDDR